jgi:hypothetical protein
VPGPRSGRRRAVRRSGRRRRTQIFRRRRFCRSSCRDASPVPAEVASTGGRPALLAWHAGCSFPAWDDDPARVRGRGPGGDRLSSPGAHLERYGAARLRAVPGPPPGVAAAQPGARIFARCRRGRAVARAHRPLRRAPDPVPLRVRGAHLRHTRHARSVRRDAGGRRHDPGGRRAVPEPQGRARRGCATSSAPKGGSRGPICSCCTSRTRRTRCAIWSLGLYGQDVAPNRAELAVGEVPDRLPLVGNGRPPRVFHARSPAPFRTSAEPLARGSSRTTKAARRTRRHARRGSPSPVRACRPRASRASGP